MQRFFNVRKWKILQEGTALLFSSTKARLVKFEVNAPTEVRLHLRYPEGVYTKAQGQPVDEVIPPGTSYFLALVKGRETLETFVDGKFELVVEGGSVHVYTADGTDTHVVVLDPVIFTKIAERRARNPQLEAIERRMYINQERRMNAQLAAMEERYGAVLTAAEERARNAEARTRQRQAPAASVTTSPETQSGDDAQEQAPVTGDGSGSGDKSAGKSGEASGAKAGKSGKG